MFLLIFSQDSFSSIIYHDGLYFISRPPENEMFSCSYVFEKLTNSKSWYSNFSSIPSDLDSDLPFPVLLVMDNQDGWFVWGLVILKHTDFIKFIVGQSFLLNMSWFMM